MNKLLIISLLVLGLISISACSSNNNANASSNANNIQDSNAVQNNANAADNALGNGVQKISDVQKTENVGKTVTVQGKVVNTLKSATYHISGYKIQDPSGMIDVSSPKQPQINTTVTVTGTIIQTRFFGLVINETG
jgi:hypothetical protein